MIDLYRPDGTKIVSWLVESVDDEPRWGNALSLNRITNAFLEDAMRDIAAQTLTKFPNLPEIVNWQRESHSDSR